MDKAEVPPTHPLQEGVTEVAMDSGIELSAGG
jgi:hypothetical protein